MSSNVDKKCFLDVAGLADTLNHVTLTSVSDEECRLTYGNQVRENMACFVGNYNQGTCYVKILSAF